MKSRVAFGCLCLLLSGCAGGEILEAGAGGLGGPRGGDTEGDSEGTEGEGGTGPTSVSGSGGGSQDGGDDGGDDDGETGDPTRGDGADDDSCVPQPEVCDGTDNDCDGVVDNDPTDVGDACDTGLLGVCAAGTTVCDEGALVCEANVMPTQEVCDGQDNDCDGVVDNGNPGGGVGCDTGLHGVCAAGTTQCSEGTIDCVANQQPSAEVCDGQDNDCNGLVDDGNPGGGGACDTGLHGVCADGTWTCLNGSLQCVQNQQPEPEICGDGLDNNCSGVIDDGCPCAHSPCVTGEALLSGCDPCVTQICAVDPFCCNTSWDSICVERVSSVCGQVCQGSCAHSPCVTGVALVSGCDPGGCVTQICAVDPFCCDSSWDGLCVSRVSSVCGLTC